MNTRTHTRRGKYFPYISLVCNIRACNTTCAFGGYRGGYNFYIRAAILYIFIFLLVMRGPRKIKKNKPYALTIK